MRVDVYDLQLGDKLARDVFTHYGLHVMSAGTVIKENEIHKLKQLGIDTIDIEERQAPRIEDVVLVEENYTVENISKQVQPKFYQAVTGIKALFDQALMENRIDKEQIDFTFEPLIQSIEREKDVVTLLIRLNTQDDYTFQHSVQVGIIAYYLAKWLEMPQEEALLVGKAGYLHDIGKSKINTALLTKPAGLTEAEYEEVKLHTIYGSQILQSVLDQPLLATTALQHHERMNGLGYPYGIKTDEIHPYAKIVAVADIYSAMISTRSYQKRRDLLVVLKELHRLSFEELDPIVTQTFIRNMIPNFIGKKLLLTTGEIGEIVMTNPSDYFRPLISINGDFIDLSKERSLDIEHIYV